MKTVLNRIDDMLQNINEVDSEIGTKVEITSGTNKGKKGTIKKVSSAYKSEDKDKYLVTIIGKETIAEMITVLDNQGMFKLEAETLTDGSKVYNVTVDNAAVVFDCTSEKNARDLFTFLNNGFKNKKWGVWSK